TLTVTRELSSNANLSGLTLSSGSLSPSFASGTLNYTASVANGVSSITVTPTTSENNATVKVNGTPVTSGSASGTIGLGVGDNPITVEVTAQDGTTTSEYTVTVTRAAAPIGGGGGVSRSNDTGLNGLTLSSGSLSPSFASDTTSYKANVAHNVNSITLTSITTDRYATVKVNGTAVSSDSASGEIALSVGDNTISITVTAEDGTTKTYTVTITRASNDIAPPISRGPLLNEKIVDAPKVREAAAATLQATAYKPFGDVTENSWSFEAIQTAQRLGIVQGRADGSFHGGDSITRAEFATMVANALYLNTASGASATFSDTTGHWAEPAIRALAAAGVIEGVGDGAFKPNQPISRAEISAILARLMVFEVSAGSALFTDTDGSWARQWIELLAGVEVVKGGSDGRFNPSAYGTREQAVAMILRMLTVCRNVDLQWAD
ncbi:cadherin-like beta sandwich domain-containing protein, partial [Cohnella boryungensis]